MKISDIFYRIAGTIIVIIAFLALVIVGANDWDTTSLGTNISVFYTLGFLLALSVAIGIIAGMWESK